MENHFVEEPNSASELRNAWQTPELRELSVIDTELQALVTFDGGGFS